MGGGERVGPGPIRRLLIANRGEIALRIIRTAREMGIETVLVASQPDAESLAAAHADRTIVIGPAPAAKSYLSHEAVLGAAREAEVDAIHPGYGFLSESADFARKVQESGLVWVGPDPESIELMGDKARAIEAAIAAGVPTLAGSGGPVPYDADLATLGEQVGFPLAIKAAAGGGGRGIRIVREPKDFAGAIDVARAESKAAFGDATVYLERFVSNARHVEVQVLGDGVDAVHFGDRDCSMQRRQQKIVEEAPAPDMPDEVRERMRVSAVELARRCAYRGAGTVEFLYDAEREEVAFIEMNTRLQVEHPITEEISGVDLVREQLRIAGGEPLGYGQDEVELRGHALEFRLNAEDPANGFMPSPGTLETFDWPGGPGVRLDLGVEPGHVVAPFYDSLIGKVIVRAASRELAIERAIRVLGELDLQGVKSTLPLLRRLVASPEFRAVEHSTTFLESRPDLMEEADD